MGYLSIDIIFLSGQVERSKSHIQPSIKDGCIFIKYIGDNSGGLVVPLSSIRMMKIIPHEGFSMEEVMRQAAATELEGMKK